LGKSARARKRITLSGLLKIRASKKGNRTGKGGGAKDAYAIVGLGGIYLRSLKTGKRKQKGTVRKGSHRSPAGVTTLIAKKGDLR